MRKLTPADGEAAVLGGSLLGGGGGGDPGWGRELAAVAFAAGDVYLAEPAELPPDGLVVTAALVGAPASPGATVAPADYLAALNMLTDPCGPIAAVITNENGGLATVNGWYQAAALGIPVLDCPGNGRAHPTGAMGSLNLDLVQGYSAVQACVCGNPPLRVLVRGRLPECDRLIRQASIEAGGLVAVARNPTTVEHVAANGAGGAVGHAIEIGRAMLATDDPRSRLANIANAFSPQGVVCAGTLRAARLVSTSGFDTGEVLVDDEAGRSWRLEFWNEYVIAEVDGLVAGVFPDLIATVDLSTGLPISTARIVQLTQGHPVAVIVAPGAALRLGRTMQRDDLLSAVARATGRSVLPARAWLPGDQHAGRESVQGDDLQC